ncbi:MAG: response regulator [Candidatus Omnitrophica bacterium]|nr:response regulator [Candidatus Omnitrophota bacterium]
MAKILIVDDDNELRGMMAGIIEAWGYEIKEADRGSEALARLKENLPDLVLLDMQLPDAKETEMLEKIRGLYPALKVAMVTANEDGDLKNRAKELGAVGYVSKPFHLEKLQQFLNEVLPG